MFIKRVTLSDFGRLTGTIHFKPNCCNVICQDNEYGKTTIMDAVLYALYNFPTSGFTRDTIKPKDKYRPWNTAPRTPNTFVVELELDDLAGRSYLLRADFTRNQPFTLHDAVTKQPIPLDGMTFGQRYLRMPLSSFTQAFFLRQDEKEGTQRSQLVSVIEEAAASNRRDTPSSVRQALESLGQPRMLVPSISQEPLLVKNLVRRLEERRDELRRHHGDLERRVQELARDIDSSEAMDGELGQLDQQVALLEHSLVAARLREKQTLLNRYKEGRDAQAEREQMLQELEPFAAFDPARRTDVMNLLSEWKLASERHDDLRRQMDGPAGQEVQQLEAQLGELPESAAALTAADVDKLRQARTVVADRRAQLERERQSIASIESTLTERGVPLDRLNELHETDSALSPSDREILFEHGAARMEAQTALAELEQNSLAFREQAMQAKNRRGWFGNIGVGITVVVVALMAFGIVLLLTDNSFFGWACIIIGAVLGAAASAFIGMMRARIAAQELDPALQGEMTLSGQMRQIREQLETVESEYQAVLDRLKLTPEQVTELREAEHWRQAAAPWVASRGLMDRLEQELEQERATVSPLLEELGFTAASDDLEHMLGAAADRLHQHQEARRALEQARQKQGDLQQRSEHLKADLDTKAHALRVLVQTETSAPDANLDELAKDYLQGCEKALRLETLKREFGAVSGMTEAEAAALQQDIDDLQARESALAAELGEDATRQAGSAGTRPEELEVKLAQLRAAREELREKRSRGFREAEQAVTDWREKGPQLERELSQVDETLQRARDFEDACQLAHGELSAIAEQVYTQWATALNERVNRIVPLLNDRYTDVAVSPNLDISVYSREAGRRLETREIQHLSKGARDQLLLAMRIAIAEYLSAHAGNLPLALDEPFAHWDDQRFIEGMKFLGRLSDSHQVILLSCHNWRYAHLRETAPELENVIHFAKLELGEPSL